MIYTFSTTPRGTTLYIDGYKTHTNHNGLMVVRFAMLLAISEAQELRRMNIQSRWNERNKNYRSSLI